MTPTTQTVADRVKDLIAKQFRLKTTVRPSIDLYTWVGASDEDMRNLQRALESEFSVDLPWIWLREECTVGDCIDLVERAVSGRQS